MPRFEIGLPEGYTLTADGLRINVLKQGGELKPFRQGERDGALPARVEVVTGLGERRQTTVLYEDDFAAEQPQLAADGHGLSVTGRHRGLALTQELKWEEIEVMGHNCLMLSRRVSLVIESAEFPDSDHVRVRALTRWGGLEKDGTYELAAHMGWHYWKDKTWHYKAWVTPCMYDADGPVAAGEGEYYDPATVHTMGLAEYTVLSWPKARLAVMVAIDPVEYMERDFNPDSESKGPAQTAYLAWFQAQDVGAVYRTPWQHYVFLEDELDPLTTSAKIWRDRFAPGINEYLQPIEELQPWMYTEMLMGPNAMDVSGERGNGNLTALEERYKALRKDPLDSQLRPILMHEGQLHLVCTNSNQYSHGLQTPAGNAMLNVPLYHRIGDLFTINCEARLSEAAKTIGLDVAVTGKCFEFESAVLTKFKRTHPYTGPSGEFPLESVQVDRDGDRLRVRVEQSVEALPLQTWNPEEYAPLFEVTFRVVREIGPDEGLIEPLFLYRVEGDDVLHEVELVDRKPVESGGFTFPPENYPLKARIGQRPVEFLPGIHGLFYEVKDGKPVRVGGMDLVRKVGELMRRYDLSIATYIAAVSMRNYKIARNANYLFPGAQCLDADREPVRIWYKGGNRSDAYCPMNEEHNRILEDCLRQLLECGPYGVYYDELAAGPTSCFGREHGHGLCQNQRFAHRRGEMMRKVAREAGYPEMYIGTEAGGFLQHTFAAGHCFDGINQARKDNNFEELKRLMIGQTAYDFPGSRAYLNYILGSQFNRDPNVTDCVFGHVLGLAFPRFAFAPFTYARRDVATYFTTAVKRAFPDHFLHGATEFPAEALRPDAPPMTSVTLALRSKEGLSVHLANLSGGDLSMEKEGYSATLPDGCALLCDSFGNVMGETDSVRCRGRDYIRLDRPAAFGVWRNEKGDAYLQALEIDRTPLKSPLRVFLGDELLSRLGISAETFGKWRGLDMEAKPISISATTVNGGLEMVYPTDAKCRCLNWSPAR